MLVQYEDIDARGYFFLQHLDSYVSERRKKNHLILLKLQKRPLNYKALHHVAENLDGSKNAVALNSYDIA